MPNLTPEEQAVYNLIKDSENRITQLQISKHEQWLGCHEKEMHLNIDKQQSTLRKIRAIIRDLRIKHGLLILSDREGYYFLTSPEQGKEFIERLEKTAKAQAKAWFVTYSAIKKNLGITSEYFDKSKEVIAVKAHTRRAVKEDKKNTVTQDRLF